MNLKKLKNKLFRRPGQRAVIAVPYIWLLVLFLIPFAIVLKISFAEQEIAIPPFTPLTTIDEDFRPSEHCHQLSELRRHFPKLLEYAQSVWRQ